MMEEITSYALLVGHVSDASLPPPALLLSQVSVQIAGVGTPPYPIGGIWARAYALDAFVIAADAGNVPLDNPSSSGPDPKHLAGAFDLHFVVSASGYVDLPVTRTCSHDAVPIAQSYALTPS